LNVSTVLVSDASKNIISSATTSTEISYLSGTTSNVQSQLNSCITTVGLSAGAILQANGTHSAISNSFLANDIYGIDCYGTFLIEPLVNNANTLTVKNNTPSTVFNVSTTTGITTANELNASNLTASTVLVADSSKNIISSSVTAATLIYMDASSSVQGQFNSVTTTASGLQAQINNKQASLSGLTTGTHIVAASASTIANSSILSESGSTLTCAGSIIPSANNTYTIGSVSKVCSSGYFNAISIAGSVINGSTGSMVFNGCNLLAYGDNSYTCGASGYRWSAVWATNGTIQTSDATQKQNILDNDLGLDFVNKLQTKKWNWCDGNTTDVQYGLVYQDIDALDSENNFGFLHPAEPTPHHETGETIPGTAGMSYSGLIAPMILAIQQLSAQVKTLQAQVVALQ
jgi:hypothetical protein